MAALVAEYTDAAANPRYSEFEALSTTDPPPALSSRGTDLWIVKKTPLKLMSRA